MSEMILCQREGDVATLLFNRDDRLNAFDLAMWRRLGEVVTELSAEAALRCLVLRGAGGRAFAAGADISEFATARANAAQAADYGRVVDEAMEALAHCPIPTLAAIQGACMGGGLEMALVCDLCIATAGSRFGIPINRIAHGLPYGGMIPLVELAGRATAMEILLEGRILSAEEAYHRGLVTRFVAEEAFEAEVAQSVKRITQGAPLAARFHKRQARRALDPRPLDAAEWQEPFALCDSEDYREGTRAFLAKEKPVFKGR